MIRNIFYSRLVVVCANSTLSRESRKASGRLGSGVAAYRETHAAGDRVNPAYSFALFIPRCLAIFIAQALSQDHFAERTSMLWAVIKRRHIKYLT
jgi:hypothetical protein